MSSETINNVSDLASYIQGRYGDSRLADVTLKCEGKEFNAHTFVLTRSEYFRACLCNEFREQQNGVISLEDTQPVILEAVLKHLYGLNYSSSKQEGTSTARFHAEIFEAGAYFQLPVLQESAARNFESALKDATEPAVMRSTALYVYLNTSDQDRRLRDHILTKIHNDAKLFFDNHLKEDLEVVEVLREIPQFAADLMRVRSGGLKLGDDIAHDIADDTADDDCRCIGCYQKFSPIGIKIFTTDALTDALRCPKCKAINSLRFARAMGKIQGR